MSQSVYSYKLTSNSLGVVVEFKGPGMRRFAPGFMPIQELNDWAKKCLSGDSGYPEREAERVLWLLHWAYEAGRQAKATELRTALDIPGKRTGEW